MDFYHPADLPWFTYVLPSILTIINHILTINIHHILAVYYQPPSILTIINHILTINIHHILANHHILTVYYHILPTNLSEIFGIFPPERQILRPGRPGSVPARLRHSSGGRSGGGTPMLSAGGTFQRRKKTGRLSLDGLFHGEILK